MAHEILSAKLCEMDTKLSKLHSRIRNGEHLSTERLKEEIEALQIEISEEEHLVFQSLLSSRADISTELREEFEVLKDEYEAVLERFQKELENSTDFESRSEKKSLFAEYGIDFAMIAADHSLLLAWEAIAADRELKAEEKLL